MSSNTPSAVNPTSKKRTTALVLSLAVGAALLFSACGSTDGVSVTVETDRVEIGGDDDAPETEENE